MRYLVGRGNLSCTIFVPWDYDLSFGCYYPSTAQYTANYDIDMYHNKK